MSKTFKDRPNRIKYPDETTYYYPEKDRDLPKKPKHVDTEWHWLGGTPSWFTRMFMNRPQRRQTKLWEREVVKTPLEDIEEVDTPNVSHKPHIYYW